MEKYESNSLLVRGLKGFKSCFTTVNTTTLHYVMGGVGQPLVLIPGYPETWWGYHKVMPLLAEHFCVIVVEMRGMGESDKPIEGYEKKNMAKDIYELVQQLGFDQVNIGGHDIGAHVAFSFAQHYPQATSKLIMLDTPHPNVDMYQLPMLPFLGNPYLYPWWLAFNQVKELPEQLLEGRMNLIIDWLFDHLIYDQSCITAFDREVYSSAYNTKDAIRASNAWYQAFPQDIEDSKSFNTLTMPVLGLGGSGFDLLLQSLTPLAPNLQLKKLENCGHFILSEKPVDVVDAIILFAGS